MRPLALVLIVLLAAPALAQRRRKPVEPTPAPAVEPVPLRQPRILEFKPQDVTGAFNKTAVFLTDRKPLREKSMVKERESFRDEIYEEL
jgi:hypothetical protein